MGIDGLIRESYVKPATRPGRERAGASLHHPTVPATLDGLSCSGSIASTCVFLLSVPMKNLLLALAAATLFPSIAAACAGVLHIEIETTGVYALDHASMVAHEPGFAECSSDRFSLSQNGRAVPIRIVDGGDGRFDAGDRIEWIGEQLHGPQSWFNSFSINNVYHLRVADGAHARMRESTEPAPGSAPLERKLHYEQENLLIRLDQSQQKPGDEPDVWQWTKLTHADPAPFEFAFDLPDLARGSGKVDVTVNLRGLSRAPNRADFEKVFDHTADVAINGASPVRLAWYGRDEEVATFSVASANLKARGNTFRISVPKRLAGWDPVNPLVDVVMFNWVDFRFDVRGDLDAGALPFRTRGDGMHAIELDWIGNGELALYGKDGVRRAGTKMAGSRYRFAGAADGVEQLPVIDGRFGAPKLVRRVSGADWNAPSSGYDYLIVTHESLADAIAPLAAFHESRGLKVATIDVSDVYDQFNHGITHPVAIRNLVKHAHAKWPEPRPRFLLLVGDASFDIRNTTADDLRYAKFASNPHELAYSGHFAGIAGTQYAEGAASFAKRNLIPTWQFPSPEGQSASDNPFGILDDGYHPAIAVGRFPVVEPAEVSAIVDKTIDYMTKPQPGSWRRDVMFITDESDYFKKASDELANAIGAQGFLADRIYASTDEANNLAHQSAIKDGLNEGQLLVHFIGHGGRYIWRTGPPDIRKNHDLFTLDDVSGLSNSGRLPMILSMTCYSAPFDNPNEDSIGERFLREADKGAVAVFAASWRNAPSVEFSKSLVTELLTPGATIGEGIVRAKRSINDRVLVEMYNLLGDPAVVLERPRDAAQITFNHDRWNPSVLVALPGTRFEGQVDVDWFGGDGERVARASYRIDEPRFSLPVPRTAADQPVTSVRMYSTDRISGRDASAGLDLAAERRLAAGTRARWTWPQWFARKPAAATTDTIARGGFEADEAQMLIAGN